MAVFRTTIPDFQLANPLYTGARVSFFTVDGNGASTGVLAPLYMSATGSTTALNPQTLDADGKFSAPVYIDQPVIAEAEGANIGSHATGVIGVSPRNRENWTSGTIYFSGDFVRDPDAGDWYMSKDNYTTGASLAADIAAGKLSQFFLQDALLTGIFLDNAFRLKGHLDATKIATFDLSAISTATTRNFTLPNASTTLVGTDVAQNLTNKTLTSAIIATSLLLNSGVVLNWNGGDLTLTHSADTLTLAGGSLVLPNGGLKVGTGVLTLGGNLITSGASALTLTTTGATSVTLPTTGTLATLAGAENLTNKTLTSPTIVTPSFTFATGAQSGISATSANTGFEDYFAVLNSGTASNTGTIGSLAAGLTGAYVQISVQGGASPAASITTAAGVTGGLTISASGGLRLTAPTLTTPVLGVATGTTLALAGTTASTSTATGALTVAGGAGIAGALNAGDTITSSVSASTGTGASAQLIASNANATTGRGGIIIQNTNGGGGLAIQQDPSGLAILQNSGTANAVNWYDKIGNNYLSMTGGATLANTGVAVKSTQASTSTTTGALTVTGGLGVAGAANIGGDVTTTGLTVSNTLGNISIYDTSSLNVGIGGQLNLQGISASGITTYGAVKGFATNGTAGVMAGDLQILTMTGGTLTVWGRFTSAGTLLFRGGGQLAGAASGTMTLPAATDTLVGKATTDTLTNKTLTSPTITTPTITGGTFAGPTLTTPVLGVASATSINKVVITAPASSATLTIADGKTLTASNTLTFTGTDTSSVAFGAGGTVAYTANNLSVFAATTSAQLAGVISDETGSGALVFGTAPTITGGTVNALTGLSVRSTGAAFNLTFASSEVLTAGRTLSFVLGDTARTLTIGASASVSGSNTGDQTITLTGDVTGSGTGSFATTIGSATIMHGMLNVDAVTGMTVNNAPNTSNDYALYWSAADGALRKITIGALSSAGASGVTSFNGRVGGVSPTSGDYTVAQVTGAAASGANTDITSVLLNQTGLVVKGATSNGLTINPNETLSAARTLNLIVNDASRTINLGGDITTAGAVTHAGAFTQTLTATANTSVTLPTSGTLLSTAAAVTVAQGGTGVATLTNHGVLIGRGTGNVAVTAAGTSGQVLTSNGASADPTFQTAAGSAYSLLQTSGTIAASTANVTFTGIAANDVILYIKGVTGSLNSSLGIAFSLDNGATWTTTPLQLTSNTFGTARFFHVRVDGVGSGLLQIAGYGTAWGTAPATSASKDNLFTTNTGSSVTTGGAMGAAVNGIRLSPVGGGTFSAGVIELWAR